MTGVRVASILASSIFNAKQYWPTNDDGQMNIYHETHTMLAHHGRTVPMFSVHVWLIINSRRNLSLNEHHK